MSQRASRREMVLNVLILRALPDGSVRCMESARAFHDVILPCGILVWEISLACETFLLEPLLALLFPRGGCDLHISISHLPPGVW